MKKILYTAGLVVLSSLFIASCQKEADIISSSEEVSPVEMVTFNFTAEKAGEVTKTQAVVGAESVSYEWTDEDRSNIKLYLVDGSALTEVASPTITKVSATRLTISATVPKADSYTFRAVLAREFYSKGKPMVSKYQSPKTDNFDPKGDILFSDDLDVDTDGTSTGTMLLTFNRKVAVSEMTLKNLGVGEKISKVEITSEAKGLVGYYDGSSIVDLSDEIVLTYANEIIPADGQFKVYFTSAPITNKTITVKVTTDSKTYTKAFARPISFALGHYRQFGVSLPEGVVPADSWDIVSDASSLKAGDVIVITNSDATKAISTTQNTNNRTAVAVTANAGKTQLTSVPATVQRITLEKDGTNYLFSVGDNAYLYAASSSNNYLKTNTKSTAGANGKWSITINASNVASITAQGTNTHNQLKNNGDLFACYSSGQTPVAIYKSNTAETTVWNLKSLAVTTNPTKDTYSTGESFNPDGMVITATYEDNAGEKADKNVVLSNDDLTFSPTLLSVADTKVQVSYCGKTVDVTGLSVNKITPTLTITPSTVNLSSIGATQQLAVSGTDGALTFVSSDESVATVSSSGLITAIGNGSTTISVSSAATDEYNAAGPVNVTVNVGSTVVTFVAGTDTGETSVTKNGVTISMTTMNNDDYYQTYKNNSMTVATVDPSKKIIEIVVTCTVTGSSKYGPGGFSGEGYTYDSSGYTGTWVGNSNSVTLTASTNQVRMTQIVVTYK